jgi:hypothetical protein
LEGHNALTAHQERLRLANEGSLGTRQAERFGINQATKG